MVEKGIVYLHIGTKHCNHLAVSLMSLWDHYDGDVCLITCGEAADEFTTQYLIAEQRFGRRLFHYHQKQPPGRAYYAKTHLGDWSPFEKTVFLDSDTLIIGSIEDVFPDNEEEVKLTCFADWKTNERPVKGRILVWDDVLPKLVAAMSYHPYPAINTGVMGFSKGSRRFLTEWKRATSKKPKQFIADEITAQLIFPQFPHQIMSDRWNASPKHSLAKRGVKTLEAAKEQDYRVIHGHGLSFYKSGKLGQDFWLPYYARAIDENWYGIREWTQKLGKVPHDYIERLKVET